MDYSSNPFADLPTSTSSTLFAPVDSTPSSNSDTWGNAAGFGSVGGGGWMDHATEDVYSSGFGGVSSSIASGRRVDEDETVYGAPEVEHESAFHDHAYVPTSPVVGYSQFEDDNISGPASGVNGGGRKAGWGSEEGIPKRSPHRRTGSVATTTSPPLNNFGHTRTPTQSSVTVPESRHERSQTVASIHDFQPAVDIPSHSTSTLSADTTIADEGFGGGFGGTGFAEYEPPPSMTQSSFASFSTPVSGGFSAFEEPQSPFQAAPPPPPPPSSQLYSYDTNNAFSSPFDPFPPATPLADKPPTPPAKPTPIPRREPKPKAMPSSLLLGDVQPSPLGGFSERPGDFLSKREGKGKSKRDSLFAKSVFEDDDDPLESFAKRKSSMRKGHPPSSSKSLGGGRLDAGGTKSMFLPPKTALAQSAAAPTSPLAKKVSTAEENVGGKVKEVKEEVKETEGTKEVGEVKDDVKVKDERGEKEEDKKEEIPSTSTSTSELPPPSVTTSTLTSGSESKDRPSSPETATPSSPPAESTPRTSEDDMSNTPNTSAQKEAASTETSTSMADSLLSAIPSIEADGGNSGEKDLTRVLISPTPTSRDVSIMDADGTVDNEADATVVGDEVPSASRVGGGEERQEERTSTNTSDEEEDSRILGLGLAGKQNGIHQQHHQQPYPTQPEVSPQQPQSLSPANYQQQNFYIPPSPHAPMQSQQVPHTRGPPSYTSEVSAAPTYATQPQGYRQQIMNGNAHHHPAAAPQLLQPSQPQPQHPVEHSVVPKPPKPEFKIRVGDPQKVGTAINPISGHTVYTVTTQTNSKIYKRPEFSVLRRYREFAWLYDQLLDTNPGIMIPQLPEKQAMGRFDTTFVENRRLGLQDFLQRCTNHPILCDDATLRLFLESDTLSMDIKQKRLEAERDRRTSAMGVGGGSLLGLVGSVVGGQKFIEFDEFFDDRRNYLDTLETQLRALHETLLQCSKSRLIFTASLAEMEAIFLNISDLDLSSLLKGVFVKLSKLQQRLKTVGEEQAKKEDEGLSVLVEGYVRQINAARLSLASRVKAWQTWNSAEQTLAKAKKTHEKMKVQGVRFSEQLDQAWNDLVEAERKAQSTKTEYQNITALVRSEVLRFDHERIEDFKSGLEEFVSGMAERQKEIVAAWEVYLEEVRETQEKILGIQRPPPQLTPQQQQQQEQEALRQAEEERREQEQAKLREEEEERQRRQRDFADGLNGRMDGEIGGLSNPW